MMLTLLSCFHIYLYGLTQQVFNKGANYIRCMATIDVRCNYHDSNQLLFSQINHQ